MATCRPDECHFRRFDIKERTSYPREPLKHVAQFVSTGPTLYLPCHDPDGVRRHADRAAVPLHDAPQGDEVAHRLRSSYAQHQ